MSHTNLCHNLGILGMTHSYSKCGMYKVIITVESVKLSTGQGSDGIYHHHGNKLGHSPFLDIMQGASETYDGF